MSIPDLVTTSTSWLTFLKTWIAGDETTTVADPNGTDRDSPRKQVQALIDAAEADIASNVAGMSVQAYGPTADRPNLGSGQVYLYWDTTLGKLIGWNGTAWVNVDGTSL